MHDLRRELTRLSEVRESRSDVSSVTTTSYDLTPEAREMVAIDGSYSFLWHMSGYWLLVAKVGALRYSCSDEGYRKRKAAHDERPLLIATWEEAARSLGEMQSYLFDVTRASGEQHREMANEFRRYLEGEMAAKEAEANHGVILVLDGSLSSFHRRRDFLDSIIESCEAGDNILVGVSKDSMTHAFDSRLTDEDLLRSLGGLSYVRAPKEFEMRQKGLLMGDVYFVRLHPRAPKWFRVDLGTFRDQPEYAFGQLAHYSRSTLSLGYPFPLVEAHRFAVIVRQLREMYENEVFRILRSQGLSPQEIMAGMVHMEGERKGSFHQYLDMVARDLR